MVPCISIISESEVSITVLCQLCLPHYTAVQKDSVIKVPIVENTLVLHAAGR